MSKVQAHQALECALPTAGLQDKPPMAHDDHNQADVQRLRSLVNLLNMRIELLESELAAYRNGKDAGDH